MHPLNVAIKDMKWQKLVPQLGDQSSEIAILRVDAKTQATQIMIRVPSNYHGAWDINWVNGPPKPEDYTPRAPRRGVSLTAGPLSVAQQLAWSDP
jgi:hypothetical protein